MNDCAMGKEDTPWVVVEPEGWSVELKFVQEEMKKGGLVVVGGKQNVRSFVGVNSHSVVSLEYLFLNFVLNFSAQVPLFQNLGGES